MALSSVAIDYDDIYKACETLSSYVAREQTDGSGNSLYEHIHILQRDRDLLMQYAVEATVDLGKKLLPFGQFNTQPDSQLGQGSINFVFDSSYDVPNGFRDLVERFIIDWTMSAWLLDKTEERATYYKAEAERLAEKIPTLIFRTKPTLA